MLILHPREVRIGGVLYEGVTLVAVDRLARSEVLEWGDEGPQVMFADVPRREVRVRVEQDLTRDELVGPAVGSVVEVRFSTSASASESGRSEVSATCVVLGVRHELSQRRGAVRVMELVAVSVDGVADPVTVQSVGV
jgi:hypothetical protein